MPEDVSQEGTGEAIDYFAFLKREWTPLDFAKLGLGLCVLGTLYYFYCVTIIYQGLPISLWAWGRFAPQYNFEHGKLVLPIFAFLVWYHREELVKAKREGNNWGLAWVALGCLIFAMGARTLQGRVGMAAGPVLLYGIVLYLWGKEIARIMLFPIGFLVFMIPVSAIEQATFRLQFLVTGIAQVVCGLVGIHLYAVGTTLRPLDESYLGFDVAEGCSGIRSLMAMVMVTAIFVHLTQNKLWKQVAIFILSIGFAILGNAGRIVSIFIVAKLFGAKFAGGDYHEVSGYVSFPIALAAMLLVSKVLEMDIFNPAKVREVANVIRTGEAKPGSGLERLARKADSDFDY